VVDRWASSNTSGMVPPVRQRFVPIADMEYSATVGLSIQSRIMRSASLVMIMESRRSAAESTSLR